MPKTKIAKVQTAYENLQANKDLYEIMNKNERLYCEATGSKIVFYERKLIKCIAQMKVLERKYPNYNF